MSGRNELAEVIRYGRGEDASVRPSEQDHDVADAILAADYVKRADAEAQAYAKVIARIELGTPYMVDEKYVAGANWVRSQIEDVLIPDGDLFPAREPQS
jgi:hypothetical protein